MDRATPRKLTANWSIDTVNDISKAIANDIDEQIIAEMFRSCRMFTYHAKDVASRDYLQLALDLTNARFDINGVSARAGEHGLIDIGDEVEVYGEPLPDVIDILASLKDGALQCEDGGEA